MATGLAAQNETAIALPTLIDRARGTLENARGAAEVLEARDMASVVYDMSKRANRLAKAKGACDELIAAGYRVQADALLIEAGARRRLADEYDAAQPPDAAVQGRPKSVPDENAFSAKGVGLTRKEVYEARIIRDAEVASPGIVRRTVDAAIESGEEPTKARVMRAAIDAVRPDQFEEEPGQSTPNTRFLNVAWDAEHRPSEFDFPAMANFGELAAAAERVSLAWSTAATELRRLEAK